MTDSFQRKLARYGLPPEDENRDPTAKDLYDLVRAFGRASICYSLPVVLSVETFYSDLGGPNPAIIKAIMSNEHQRGMLYRELKRLCSWGSCPVYEKGKVYL